MSSLFGGNKAGAQPTTANVQSGATGASGIQGGWETPDLGTPGMSAGLSKVAGAMTPENELLKKLFDQILGGGFGHSGGAYTSGGGASFQVPPNAVGSHSLSLENFFGGSGGSG